eukprot:TRINITY_DN5272_c0_g1_i4.p1 TRINITY_DN5272_c0_g1~~TRINITY_DN5272_c0_g1_i4.p1  ORF type:complete len:308 (+),score=48.73 TRINITY_DN5272_c0_g1_i4:48-971(+)
MPRSSRLGGAQVPPLQSGSLGTHRQGARAEFGSVRQTRPLDSQRLKEHVMRSGRTEVDVRLWVRQVCNTPREEDPHATWSERTQTGRSGTSEECLKTAASTSPSDRRAHPAPMAPEERPGGGVVHSVLLPRTASAPAAPRGFVGKGMVSKLQGLQGIPTVRLSPFIGMEIGQERGVGGDGLRVVRITHGSPAGAGGLQVGDCIKAINGKRMGSKHNLRTLLASLRPDPTARQYAPLYIDALRPAATLVKLKVTPVAKAAPPASPALGAAAQRLSPRVGGASSQHSATFRSRRCGSYTASQRRSTLYP